MIFTIPRHLRFLFVFLLVFSLGTLQRSDAARTASQMVQVVLGSSDCPVKIYRPTTDWIIPYTYADGVANTAKLNELFRTWGQTGKTTGVIRLPPGVLYTVGTVFIPQNVSATIEGTGMGYSYSDVSENNRAGSRWHMEKAAGAGAFCPGVMVQTFGLQVRNIVFSTRHKRLANDPVWLGTPPSQCWYIAPNSIAPGESDYITWQPATGSPIGPTTTAGGTGKHTFEFCMVNNSPSCPFVQTCHVSRPTANNADTVTLRHIQHYGSGPLVLSASEQNVKLVIDELYFEGFDSPNIVDSYKIGGLSILGGTLAHPCTLVKLRSEIVGAEPLLQITGMQLDNNCVPGTVLFDGWDATSNQAAVSVNVTNVNWTYNLNNVPWFKVSANQHLTVRGCTQVPPNLFATKNVSVGYLAYGETAGYMFRPGITVRDSQIAQYAKSPTMSLLTLRSAAASTGAYYNFRTRDNYDALQRWFDDEDIEVAP